jgi:hypothetical protein
MQELRHKLAEGHAKLDQGHQEARKRLLAILPAVSLRPEPARILRRTANWMKGLTMRQRIVAFGGVGLAVLLAFLLLWGGIDTKPVSAMEQMAENVRKVKSMKCSLTISQPAWPEAGRPPAKTISAQTHYWLTPGSTRVEIMFTSKKVGSG